MWCFARVMVERSAAQRYQISLRSDIKPLQLVDKEGIIIRSVQANGLSRWMWQLQELRAVRTRKVLLSFTIDSRYFSLS